MMIIIECISLIYANTNIVLLFNNTAYKIGYFIKLIIYKKIIK